MQINLRSVDEIISRALDEDIGTGDLTTLATVPPEAVTHGFIYAKKGGVLAGLPVAERVFALVDSRITFAGKKTEGAKVSAGDILAEVSGPAQSILMGERVALNLLQRMSGIATQTARLVELVSGTGASVVDTRKTAPGLRVLDKYAVRAGGGKNHRFGLYDGILIKDNHIKVAGGIRQAVHSARDAAPHTIKVEVEVESLAGVREALEAGADIVLLDNMDVEKIREAVKIVNRRIPVEVSGGVNEDNIKELAQTGVDILSTGAVTHSVKALDISLDLKEIKTKA